MPSPGPGIGRSEKLTILSSFDALPPLGSVAPPAGLRRNFGGDPSAILPDEQTWRYCLMNRLGGVHVRAFA